MTTIFLNDPIGLRKYRYGNHVSNLSILEAHHSTHISSGKSSLNLHITFHRTYAFKFYIAPIQNFHIRPSMPSYFHPYMVMNKSHVSNSTSGMYG